MKNLYLTGLLLLTLFGTSCQPKSSTVTLALLGDMMLGRDTNPKPDSFAILAPHLTSADLVLANLESPLSVNPPVSGSSYNLCAPSSRADLLAHWGFNLLSIANNHQSDCGPIGPDNTRFVLESVGITPIGPGMEPVKRLINGLSLVFLAFNDISSPLDINSAIQVIRSANATGAVVIVSIHWGMEYQGGASDRQKNLAHQFTDAGALLIWGHHPHVLQPAEWIETSEGKALVLYSLGNALFDQGGLSNTSQSALVILTLGVQGVTQVLAIPFDIDVMASRLVQPDLETSAKIHSQLGLP